MTDPIHTLIDASELYLRRFDDQGPRTAVEAVARRKTGPLRTGLVPRQPSCGFLDEALTAIHGADALRAAIMAARPLLHWITYDGYPEAEIGSRFPRAHSFVSLIGEAGHVAADNFDLGLFLIAPRTLYRDHHHLAPELYAPLTGPHGWRFGPDAPWTGKPAHDPVWNEPWAPHATLVRDVPFLCLFCWTRDVNSPAKVVPASDWAVIEQQL